MLIKQCPNCKADNPDVFSRIDAEHVWCSACDQQIDWSISDDITVVMENILEDESLGIIRDALSLYFESEMKANRS